MGAHDNAFWGQCESWHKFRFIFFTATRPARIEDLVTTTTDHDQSGRVQVCPLKHVLTMLNEHEVKFVDLRFTDTKGKEQHVTIPAHQVNAEFFEEGKMFDGSSIGGWKGINESDMVLMPDASHGSYRPVLRRLYP
ncbi:glutamine synthetase [Salmonella bongori]|nr:glutamine synthetase [Salmonella bongori]